MMRKFLFLLALLFVAPSWGQGVSVDVTKTGIQSQYLGEYAYASLPSAANNKNRTALATDIGVGPGMMLISDGTRWIPNGAQVLARSAVAVSAGADVTEDTLATVTVPANLMGINGRIVVTTIWTMTNGANNKSPRIRFGGAAGTLYFYATYTTTTGIRNQTEIANRGAANSQIGLNSGLTAGFGGVSSANTTSAVDTTAATTLVIAGQKASAGDALTLESYVVVIYP